MPSIQISHSLSRKGRMTAKCQQYPDNKSERGNKKKAGYTQCKTDIKNGSLGIWLIIYPEQA